MRKKDIKIRFQAEADDRISLENIKKIPEDLAVDFGKELTKTRIKVYEILDSLYKQIENEIVKHQEIKNEEYYILINHEELHDIYKANDCFIDINNITNNGLYGDEKKLLGIKFLISENIKKAELVRKV